MVTEDLSFKQDELPADRSLVIIDNHEAFVGRQLILSERQVFGYQGSLPTAFCYDFSKLL